MWRRMCEHGGRICSAAANFRLQCSPGGIFHRRPCAFTVLSHNGDRHRSGSWRCAVNPHDADRTLQLRKVTLEDDEDIAAAARTNKLPAVTPTALPNRATPP